MTGTELAPNVTGPNQPISDNDDTTPQADAPDGQAGPVVDPAAADAQARARALWRESRPGLPAAEAQARARALWRESGRTLTGAELGQRFGRGERWGRKQIAAARAADTDRATGPAADRNGTRPAPRTDHSGTPAPVPAGPAAHRAARTARTAGTRADRSAHNAGAGTVPVPLAAVTVAAVALVTTVCAVVSYSHIRDLAVIAGMSSTLAAWLPLGLDGLVVACSCSLLIDRHRGRSTEPLAALGVALGLAGSLAANVLAVDPDLVSLRAIRMVLAGYPPAALAVSGHLLFRMLGDRHRPTPTTRTATPKENHT